MVDKCLKTALSRNSTRTAPSHCEISRNRLPAVNTTPISHTILMTSMPSPRNWASHGSEPKIILSHHQLPIGVSNGMPNRNKSPWERRKRKNTLMPYTNGCFRRPTLFTKCKSYTGNSSIRAILCHVDERTLPSWRPCYGSVTTILSSHIPIQKDSEMTPIGGLTSSANQLSPDQYPDPYHSTMLGHSLM